MEEFQEIKYGMRLQGELTGLPCSYAITICCDFI